MAGRAPVSVQPAMPPGGPGAAAEPAPGGYQEALRYLAECVDLEKVRQQALTPDQFRLDRMRAMLDRLGDPHRALRCVHVAGTKGKGSTCEMTASCLEACGYAVGLYTSPHLVDVRERIRVNRRMIPYAAFAAALNRVREAAAAVAPRHGPATYFEHLTAMAFLHFAEEAVDVAVVEVGVGGRLDSTNVITPEVAAVTSISLDHTALLGGTVEQIAREKAGIFKPGIPAITIDQKPEVVRTLREVAQQVGAPFRVVGGDAEGDVDFSVRFVAAGGRRPQARVCLNTPRCAFEHLPVPLLGEHQARNCGLALGIIDALVERGLQCPPSAVSDGLARTALPGRLEQVGVEPRIFLDGAHNEDSMACLVRALGACVDYDSLVVVFGCCADKDVNGMLRQLAQGADKVIFTRAAGTPRAARPDDLARRFNDLSSGKMCLTAPDLAAALAMAVKGVGRGDLVCVTGSLYLVGEARKLLGGRRGGGA
jgi:dihydrofolate synthase/folylpolyglutamate synthase